MPVQITVDNRENSQQKNINDKMAKNMDEKILKQQFLNNRTESMETLTTPDIFQPNFFNVGDTLINLMSSLEDVQGQFSELHSLQENVINLYKVLCQISKLRIINTNLQNQQVNQSVNNNLSNLQTKRIIGQQPNRVRRASDASNISVSVESALECFDFLNQAGTDSEVDSVCTPEHRQFKDKNDLHLIINNQNNNDSALSTPCATPSPSMQSAQHLSTNCDQIDISLMSHLIYCQRLIENLGAFGPLRSREKHSLSKLQAQSQAIERLVLICSNLRDYIQVSIELRKDLNLKQHPIDSAYELEKLHIQFKQQQDLELTNFFLNDSRIEKIWDFICYLHKVDHEDEQLVNQLAQMDLNNSNNRQNITLGNTLLCCTSASFSLCLQKFIAINNLVNTNSNSANNTLGN